MEERFAVHMAANMDVCQVIARVGLSSRNRFAPWGWLGIGAIWFGLQFADGIREADFVVLAIAVILSWQLFYYNRIGYAKGMYNALRIPGMEIDYRFSDDAVRSTDELQKVEASYRSYSRFVECRGCYLLCIGTGKAVVLKKSAFTTGNPDDFPGFFFEKTGLKLEHVK